MPPDDVMTRASDLPDAVLRYASHGDGLVDVLLPADVTRPVPLVVYVHGGFWREAFDRTHARPLANALAAWARSYSACQNPPWTTTPVVPRGVPEGNRTSYTWAGSGP